MVWPVHVWHCGSLDRRLEEDIRHVMTLPQGVKVCFFRYKGDSRTFTGLMAQDLLEDERDR